MWPELYVGFGCNSRVSKVMGCFPCVPVTLAHSSLMWFSLQDLHQPDHMGLALLPLLVNPFSESLLTSLTSPLIAIFISRQVTAQAQSSASSFVLHYVCTPISLGHGTGSHLYNGQRCQYPCHSCVIHQLVSSE